MSTETNDSGGTPIRLRLTKRRRSYGGGWRFWVEYRKQTWAADNWVSVEQGNRPLMGWAFRVGLHRLGAHMSTTHGCAWSLWPTEVNG